MLTKIVVRNFKLFDEVEIELGNPVVFIGPNNSGKTSALQAITLWDVGLKRWLEKRGISKNSKVQENRPGVTINRKDLLDIPIPVAKLLWKNLHTHNVGYAYRKRKTSNEYIEIILEGIIESKQWECGFEFYYGNPESFYCRPLRLPKSKKPERMPIPEYVEDVKIDLLPPMSGLASSETLLTPGAIDLRIGEGRTAEVLRNLCYIIYSENKDKWKKLKEQISSLFNSELEDPKYISERGELELGYRENDNRLDISSTGRGLQQTLLLLAYMYARPNTVILLDEPDAHLEIIRQREIYNILTEVAVENSNQLIIASHSEIILEEAADKDVVIAFVGKPHRINDRGSQVKKALRTIGYQDYYQAEQKGWILYLEGSSDLAIIRSFAEKLEHQEAIEILKRPFVKYVGNVPSKVSDHFHGLKEAYTNLKGIALFDRLDSKPDFDRDLKCVMWKKREIENYLCYPEVLENYAVYGIESYPDNSLFLLER